MRDGLWKLLFIVRNHDKCLARNERVVVDDIANHATTLRIKTMKRLVEDKEVWRLHEGTSKKNEALLTA